LLVGWQLGSGGVHGFAVAFAIFDFVYSDNQILYFFLVFCALIL